ncbi:hypothetical protein E4T56_gene13910 [Termitomyces sp. T112]|nr:hypothetical protein E4T56_gene13910 [Termitomyces sp. T112]
MMFRAITIVALIGFVSANSYSIGCMNSLMAIGQDPAAHTCLKPAQLLTVMIGAGNGPESVIGYLDTWLESMCGAPACSDDTLIAVLSNLTTSCSDEFGLSSSRIQQTIATVKAGYKTVREVACLKDSNSGGINCVTGTLRNVEVLTGTMNLNVTDIRSIANLVKEGFPSSVVCTDCMKGAFTLMNQTMPGSFSTSDIKRATELCGASFVDGGIPPGLVSAASGAIAKNVTSTTNPAISVTTSSFASTTSTPTFTTTPTPTPTKKNAAPRRGSAMSLAAFLVISGLVASIVDLM